MYILHILDELKPSGAESMLNGAAMYWYNQGLESDILSTGQIRGAYAAILEKSGYHIYHIPFSPSFSFLFALYRFLKKRHYDIVHIHAERANFWYAFITFISGNSCIVRTIHSVFQFQGPLRLERYIQRWIMRKIFGVLMITIGRSVNDNEWKTFGNHSVLIPNWFDSTKFKPASVEKKRRAKKALGIPDNVTIFTSIGGCMPAKNHSAIIDAVAHLPENTSVAYIHVGPEEAGYPERQFSQTLGASNRVHFLGTVLDIVPILNASDIYIMPSFYEGFSIAAIEAMGAGLPAVLSCVPGLRDLQEVCSDIYWIEPTSDSIKKAILHFSRMSHLSRHEIGMNLSMRVHNHFSIEKGANAYVQVYRSLKDQRI
jgi:glycosyltransferase involved in cell wall biosynthesis